MNLDLTSSDQALAALDRGLARAPGDEQLRDAEQNGRWRTPPFKALLRQWRQALSESPGDDQWRLPCL